MRKLVAPSLGITILGAFIWTLFFLYGKSQSKPKIYKTDQPFVTDIIKKTVATGYIVPRKEIAIKPRVSGVIETLYVQPGERVKKGDKIAKIRLMPKMLDLNRAESTLKAAQISFGNARAELARHSKLLAQKVISHVEYSRFQLEYRLKAQELQAARNAVQLIKEGKSGNSKVSNVVMSTVDGMVLEVPVEEGASVTETNNFNEGTTIASVADMSDLIFKGKVDESEVGKIRKDMELDIKIGALDKRRFKAKLEYIAPKGTTEEGSIQFEIWAAIKPEKDVFIRAQLSANADIVLDRRNKVLSIKESLLQFEKGGSRGKGPGKTFVEVEIGEQSFEKRYVEVGLSDGINIEIKSGIDKSVRIKKPS